jgi:hypothetical protein
VGGIRFFPPEDIPPDPEAAPFLDESAFFCTGDVSTDAIERLAEVFGAYRLAPSSAASLDVLDKATGDGDPGCDENPTTSDFMRFINAFISSISS